jgi:hypothetical protein
MPVVRHRTGPFGIATGNNDVDSAIGELTGNGKTNATRGAGNESCLHNEIP